MASLSLFLKEHSATLPDLKTVYIGEVSRGEIIAGYNPGHLDTDALTTHTTEVFRAMRRLHSSVIQASESSYFISTNRNDRIIVQKISATNLYLAMITGARESLQTYLPTFKTLLDESRTRLSDEPVVDIGPDTATP